MNDSTERREGAEKSQGQLNYEQFCEQEYRQHGRVWNRWELLPMESKAEWEVGAILYPDDCR